MVHISLYIEDEIAAKLEEHKQVRRNKNTSQVVREILYDFFDKIADKSAKQEAEKDTENILQPQQ